MRHGFARGFVRRRTDLSADPDQAVALRRRRLRHPVAALGDSVQLAGVRCTGSPATARERQALGPDVALDIVADRRDQHPHPARPIVAADPARPASGWSCWSACSRTSSRGPSTSRGRCARPASRSASAASMSPACSRCCRRSTPNLQERSTWASSCSPARPRGPARRGAARRRRRHAEAALQLHGRPAGPRGRAGRRSCRADGRPAHRSAA